MATAGDIINGCLRLIGQLAEGETPTAATAEDALSAMNQMIDSWNTERLSTFTTQDQVFSWAPGLISRTIGPTGDFVGNRPIGLDDASYFKVGTISYGFELINQEQYDGIALKTSTSTFPQVMYYAPDFPNATMYLYPVPTTACEFHFVSVTELTQPATLATVLAFPPGYLRAFRFNLACEIAAEWGVEPSPQVQKIAAQSKRNLKRINQTGDVMSMPESLLTSRPRFNVYAGNY